MLVFNSGCFNLDYLKAIQISRIPTLQTSPSRVGDVFLLGHAVFIIESNDPRLIFLKNRNLNYLFAIKEAIWVLEGSNDLEYLRKEISNYSDFSDDGKTLNGAYGHRLRKYFPNQDQIETAIEQLHKDKNSRRIVLNLYSIDDICSNSKDIPCNTHIYLKIINNKLDLTVSNRSNDVFLGIPYNIFIFGILQKYIASKLDIPIGIQRHFTDNLHLYKKDIQIADSILSSNDAKAVIEQNKKFNWAYSEKILSNKDSIFKEDYELIKDIPLRRLCTKYRVTNPEAIEGNSEFFLNFLLQEKHARIKTKDASQIVVPVKKSSQLEFKAAAWLAERELFEFVKNNFFAFMPFRQEIIEYLNDKSSVLKLSQNTSEIMIYTIILSAIISQIDTLIANTDFGSAARNNIFQIASELEVDELLPIHWFDNNFFDFLDSLIEQ